MRSRSPTQTPTTSAAPTLSANSCGSTERFRSRSSTTTTAKNCGACRERWSAGWPSKKSGISSGGNHEEVSSHLAFLAFRGCCVRRRDRERREGTRVLTRQCRRRQELFVHAGQRQAGSGFLHVQSVPVGESVRAAPHRHRQAVSGEGRDLLRDRFERRIALRR